MSAAILPDQFIKWFAERGWSARAHQIEVLAKRRRENRCSDRADRRRQDAGRLPADAGRSGRPAEAASPARRPASTRSTSRRSRRWRSTWSAISQARREMGLPITLETRTGDTPASKRAAPEARATHILLTTPEQLCAAASATSDAKPFFGSAHVVLDELHSLVTSKRGELLSLGLARIARHRASDLRITRCSAPPSRGRTVRATGSALPAPDRADHRGRRGEARRARSSTAQRVPWPGHSAQYAIAELYETIKRTRRRCSSSIRAARRRCCSRAVGVNDDILPIALHHGSLDRSSSAAVSRAPWWPTAAAGRTSTLDLGIDWGDVDLVVQVGAPKGASRMLQRIGRANHRMDEPSKAVLVPSNRFEVLECEAALEASREARRTAPTRSRAARRAGAAYAGHGLRRAV